MMEGALEDLRCHLKSIAENDLSDEKKAAVMNLLLQLKTLNRSSFDQVMSKKQVVDDARAIVDSQQLRLDNLVYQKNHLLREIRKNREVETSNLDTVENDTGKTLKHNIFSENLMELHSSSIKLMTEEMELRKSEKRDLLKIQEEIESIKEITKKKRKFLDSVLSYGEKIESSLFDLKEKFVKESTVDTSAQV